MPGLPAPPPPHIIPQKPKKPHVKKPLNAFMLFMKEQRAQVVSECTLRESAAINQILGRKWHELERADQAKYYEMARQERLKHMQLHPGWSARDNYGLKKKRRRKREKVIGENGELPSKCRARYGLHQIALWCKPCRRKKKCIRFAGLDEGNGILMNPNGMIMGPNGQMYPSGVFSNGSVGEGSSGGVGSGGSLNGVNSEDDYENYDDEAIDAMEDDDDDDEDDDDEYTDDDDDEPDSNNASSIKDSTNTASMGHLSQMHGHGQHQQNSSSHNHGNHNNHSSHHNHNNNNHHHNHHQNKKPNLDLDSKAGLMHQIRMNEINQLHQQQQQQQQQQHFNHLLP